MHWFIYYFTYTSLSRNVHSYWDVTECSLQIQAFARRSWQASSKESLILCLRIIIPYNAYPDWLLTVTYTAIIYGMLKIQMLKIYSPSENYIRYINTIFYDWKDLFISSTIMSVRYPKANLPNQCAGMITVHLLLMTADQISDVTQYIQNMIY